MIVSAGAKVHLYRSALSCVLLEPLTWTPKIVQTFEFTNVFRVKQLSNMTCKYCSTNRIEPDKRYKVDLNFRTKKKKKTATVLY